jgi:hypothetical protein
MKIEFIGTLAALKIDPQTFQHNSWPSSDSAGCVARKTMNKSIYVLKLTFIKAVNKINDKHEFRIYSPLRETY